jgi:hypothetical protein
MLVVEMRRACVVCSWETAGSEGVCVCEERTPPVLT